MRLLNVDDLLHVLSFVFTVVIIVLAITKGLSDSELVINISYFIILNITLIRYIIRVKDD